MKEFCFALSIVLVSIVAANPISHQDAADLPPLDQVIPDSEMNDMSVGEAFAHLLISNHITGGMALSFVCTPDGNISQPKHFFTLSGLTVRQALDEVVRQDENYQWKQANQMIILYPRHGMPDILNTEIGHLEINEEKYTLSAASDALLQLPEIKARKAQLKLQEGTKYIIGGIDRLEMLKSKVSMVDVTMYEALNAIARVNGSVVWRYAESHCNGENLVNVTWVVR
jgi:hypothetical protein